MPNPTLKMDSVTVLDKDSDGVHFKNSLIHSSTTFPTGMPINVTSTSITRASNQFTSTSFTDIADDQSNALSLSVTPKTNVKYFY